MTNRIALFGGAFDPPHLGHTFIINLLLNSGVIDQVWILPSGVRNDKKYHATDTHRLRMVELTIKEFFGKEERVSLNRVDQLHDNPLLGTIGLVSKLEVEYPNNEFWFVIGSELLTNLPRWREPERLKSAVNFLVVTRSGVPQTAAPQGFKVQYVPNHENLGVSVSSTTIRKMCLSRSAIEGLVPASVGKYILANNLYRKLY